MVSLVGSSGGGGNSIIDASMCWASSLSNTYIAWT